LLCPGLYRNERQVIIIFSVHPSQSALDLCAIHLYPAATNHSHRATIRVNILGMEVGFLMHSLDSDRLARSPNACFFSGASMFAKPIFSGFPSTRRVSVSPSVMRMTSYANALEVASE
jgi:hypothetical protein